jgi:hypothetical protein
MINNNIKGMFCLEGKQESNFLTGVRNMMESEALRKTNPPTGLGFGYISSKCTWRSYTTKLEPIFSKKRNPEPRRLSAVGRTRPAQKTLCIFFEISPPRFF